MNQELTKHPFPLLRCILALTGVALVAGILCSFGVPAVLKMVVGAEGDVGSAKECAVAAVVVWVGGMLGVVPVSLFGPLGVMATVRGWFMGTGLKLVLSLAAAVGLIKAGGYSVNSVMLTLAFMYLAMLPASMFFVLNYLRAKDGLAKADSGLAMETSV